MNKRTKDGGNAERGTFSVYSDSDFKGKCPRRIIRLQKILKKMKRVVIAFSGGLDSTFLLKVAHDTLGRENVLAVIARSATYPEREYESAMELARKIDSDCVTVYTKETKDKAFLRNPINRCYYCKKELFSCLKNIASGKDFNYVLDGFNHDDKKDLRFGSIAGRELGVRSPLAEAGIGKAEIRVFSKRLGLSTWSKPSLACLASRVPYGDKITGEKLKKIDQAEEMLQKCGFKQVRVRLHGDIARIELLPADIKKFSDENLRRDISCKLRRLGFLYSALDLEGYRTGSMNEVIGVDKSKLK
ncbi:MAG: ATP-dependent sacrificial sulfur transferase LarE [Candidatus Omnitrophota bacterium]|nr:ATP-dependent sacrificial sulfur transferase LarE [Candidatus Omnitrophota bacterium]